MYVKKQLVVFEDGKDIVVGETEPFQIEEYDWQDEHKFYLDMNKLPVLQDAGKEYNGSTITIRTVYCD